MAQRDELEMAPDAAEVWPDRIYDLLKEHDIRQVALVPDAGHSRLIRRAAVTPTPRRPTKPTLASKRRRLDSKARRSRVKSLRGHPHSD